MLTLLSESRLPNVACSPDFFVELLENVDLFVVPSKCDVDELATDKAKSSVTEAAEAAALDKP